MQQNQFPLSFFPKQIVSVIKETCGVYQFNHDFLASAILSTCATAIGNTYCLRFKEGWIERPSLYIAIVAEPGINKSAPLSWALRPLEHREKELFKAYKAAIRDFAQDPKNKDSDPPPLIKTIVSDATPEAVTQQLSKNERGIMIYNDELSGFLNTFQRYNKGNDEQFYLQVWSGKAVVVDRKTSASIRINEPVLNIIGTIQPSVFEKSFANKEDSGFFDRWLIVNPHNAKKSKWTDEDLRPEVYATYQRFIDRLQDTQVYINQYDDPEARQLTYSGDARRTIMSWQSTNTDQVNNTDISHVRSIRAKIEIYVHRFAAIAHLIDYATADLQTPSYEVSQSAVERAIALCEYFIANAVDARSGEMIHRLPEKWQELYDFLPANDLTFSTIDFVSTADTFQIPERTAKRFLNSNIGKIFTKVKHGTYSKI